MKETQDLIAAWRRLGSKNESILATVVGTSGSTYRRPGARMLISREGWQAGSVSGGCLESDLVQSAWDRTQNGSALIVYDASTDDDAVFGFGLGCNGVVQVLLERLPADGGILPYLEKRIRNDLAAVVATVISEGSSLGRHWTLSEDFAVENPNLLRDMNAVALSGGCTHRQYGDMLVLLESLLPPLPLVVFGAGHDAVPLVGLAKQLGWKVTVVDSRSGYLDPRRFPEADALINKRPEAIGELDLPARSVCVVMTHSFLADLDLLRMLLPSGVEYVGLMGPRRRADRLLKSLAEEGRTLSADQKEKLQAPIGLDLGSEEPHEIALSIVSQIQAFVNRRKGGFLSSEDRPLHSNGALHPLPAMREVPSCANLV